MCKYRWEENEMETCQYRVMRIVVIDMKENTYSCEVEEWLFVM